MIKISSVNPKIFSRSILIIVLVIIVIVLGSCITEKKRAEICKSCAIKETTFVKDSSWQKKYDSLLKIPVAGPKIILKDNPCALLCDSLGKVKDFSHTEISKTGIKGTLKGDKKTNSIICDCASSDSLEILLKDARIENNHFRSENKTIEVESKCKQQHRTGFDTFCRWFFWIIAIIVVFFILLLYLQSKFGKRL